ncbi:aldose epimerase family protein [Halanaerobium hydrogeniformans]|uniref:Aldose 1-epimerase n=1 Tax=Halanaerobium hydrogeniformans TaxID=656519 RepID=E4RPY6_HALHG|nr:aldose epimerase family protein [Halanaerobium hydrogeniformans]ADQ14353.1 Aldose 1-epimerase [Halanaerobium hydrogeniformans]
MSNIKITKDTFAKKEKIKGLKLYSLENENGIKVDITNYGGIIQKLIVPDRYGNKEDIVLGYNDYQHYLRDKNYFGALIGRYANRIAEGKFELDGQKYQVQTNEEINDRLNCLHGGEQGFNSVIWKADVKKIDSNKSLSLSYLSKDGEAGFPGNIEVTVNYILRNDNTLRIEYHAKTDQTTVVNLTQHSYFNLKGHGEGKITDHLLQINADYFTPVDKFMIPTGEIKDVNDTPFDFRSATEIGSRVEVENEQLHIGGGYDHNWILNKEENELSLAAKLIETFSGRTMEVWTTEPGLQFYSGNVIDTGNIEVKDKQIYQKRGALCLETQHYPDSPNQPNFPSTVLEAGEEYNSITELRFNTQ